MVWAGDEDFPMPGGMDAFGLGEKFFVEFVARAQVDELEFDVHPGFHPGQTDHLSGQIQDTHGLAHVQDENLAVFPHGAALNDEPGGLRDGHKVACGLGLDGDGAALANLLLKEGHNRAAGAQDIAEANGDVDGVRIAGEAFDLELGEAFARAVNAGGTHGLVRGDHDEPAGAVFTGQFGNGARADDVVLDDLFRVGLDEVHVLVGSGVEDDMRPVFLKNVADALRIPDIRNDRRHRHIRKPVSALQMDVVDALFPPAQKDELPGREPADLTAEFRADGPARAGHQNGLIFEIGGNLVQVDVDFVPAEEVLDLEISHNKIVGDKGRGSGDKGDKETRRQGDKEMSGTAR